MLVKIGKQNVDVLERACANRTCFALGFDKGSFTPGRGYTNYHKDSKGKRVEKPVCSTRQFRGCPSNSVCPLCRLAEVDPVGAPCRGPGCEGVTVAMEVVDA